MTAPKKRNKQKSLVQWYRANKLEREKWLPECAAWYKNPSVNPKTGRKLAPGSGVADKFNRYCAALYEAIGQHPSPKRNSSPKRKSAKRSSAKRSSPCDTWSKNPLINPHTGRAIIHNGPTYKKLVADCKINPPTPSPRKSPPKSPRKLKRAAKRAEKRAELMKLIYGY